MGKSKKKWYQTGEFEDGYQFGDIFRTVKNAVKTNKKKSKSENKKSQTSKSNKDNTNLMSIDSKKHH